MERELYNGNILESFWISNSDNTKRKYGYVYDNLNRLTEAIYQKPDLGNPAQEATNAYNEEISYDRNVNILTLKRNGYQDNDNGYYYPIDNLVYTYSDNQLKTVVEESNSFNGFKDGKNPDDPDDPDYEYDGYGNMLQDWNKGISNITYNHLNLPTKIEFGKDGLRQIEYLYNALGVKLKKVVNDKTVEPSTYQQTDYLDGFQYVGDKLQFFPTGEGYVSVIDNEFRYVYNYTDHLGNIRLSYSQPKVGYPVEVLEENHYYPFGMKHSNYAGEKYGYVKESGSDGYVVLEAVERSNYQYKFQGQERQDELGLNWDSFKWRNYDYAIGRFMNIDPLAEKYNYQSPYNFSENRVVDCRELEGLEAVKSTDGNCVDVTIRVKPINKTDVYPLTNQQISEATANFVSQTNKSYSGKTDNNQNVIVSVIIDENATLTASFVDVPVNPSASNDANIENSMNDGMVLMSDFGNSQTGDMQISSLANFEGPGRELGYTGTPGHTASHELGHLLGLPHLKPKNTDGSDVQGKLMKDGSRSDEREVTPAERSTMLENIPEVK